MLKRVVQRYDADGRIFREMMAQLQWREETSKVEALPRTNF